MKRLKKKGKRRLEEWPPHPLGPFLMESSERNPTSFRDWGADRIVQYTRATLDSTLGAL